MSVLKKNFETKFKKFIISFIIFSIICTSVKGAISGTFSQVIEGFDWGPCVTKMIITLESSVTYSVLDHSAFSVETTKEGNDDPVARTVNRAYFSDKDGNSVTEDSKYITLELSCHPAEGETNPFYYSSAKSLNDWANPYTSSITLTQNTGNLEAGGITINNSPQSRYLIGVDGKFTINKEYTHNSITLKYAYHKSSSSSNRGVVIWLHGTGEGGTDTTICLYGNKVTNLISDSITTALNDCDILVVQCPSRWLTYTTGNVEDSVNPIEKYQSIYTEALYSLIDNYVKNNNVSKKRIYIGGASNGGSMTMNMILNYPEYFAAAYFASEGYADRHITDDQINLIKNIPLWFVYAVGDTTNDPAKTSQATYDRLVAVGATNIHLSKYSDGVVDLSGNYKKDDGTAYVYGAHWSWIYVLNNDCKDGTLSIFSWLGQQSASESASEEKEESEESEESEKSNGSGSGSGSEGGSSFINFRKITSLLLFIIILF